MYHNIYAEKEGVGQPLPAEVVRTTPRPAPDLLLATSHLQLVICDSVIHNILPIIKQLNNKYIFDNPVFVQQIAAW